MLPSRVSSSQYTGSAVVLAYAQVFGLPNDLKCNLMSEGDISSDNSLCDLNQRILNVSGKNIVHLMVVL